MRWKIYFATFSENVDVIKYKFGFKTKINFSLTYNDMISLEKEMFQVV